MVIRDRHWSMKFDVDEDDAGVFPMCLRFTREGFPWPDCDVPQHVRDQLVGEAYAVMRARGLE